MNQKTVYLLKRVGLTIFSLYAIVTVIFFLFRLVPGDPTTAILNPRMTEETRQIILETYGLTKPLHEQYVIFIGNLLTFNLGVSYMNGQLVSTLLFEKTLNTMALVMFALILAFLLGPLIGAYIAWYRGSKVDSIAIAILLTLRGAPVFWTGMLGIMLFSFTLGWLPPGGLRSAGFIGTQADKFLSLDFLYHLVLPLSVTTAYFLSMPAFVMRNSMIDVLNEEFIELCRARGMSNNRILYLHAARNSLLPVLHYSAVVIGFGFGGSVVIEVVFSWPGLGLLMFDAVMQNDYPVAQASFVMLATIILALNLLADSLSSFVDPRAVVEGVG